MDFGIEEMGYNPQQRGLYHPDFETANCGAGFICNMKGRKSHDIIHKALEILVKLTHRGAVSADGKTGDGAGLMIQVPHDFLKERCSHIGFSLPDKGDYAVGMVFLPSIAKEKENAIKLFNEAIANAGLDLLGWREVPVDKAVAGEIAARTLPAIKQVFIGKDTNMTEQEFRTKLYIVRRHVENMVAASALTQKSYFYLPSLSTTTMIFKGLLTPEDMVHFYTDLQEEDLVTALALVHQRFSTNTFPKWDLAQPFRYICHNGEINTLRGNINRMSAREELYESEIFGDDIKKITPTVIEGRSDSASLDNVVELMTLTGRSLPEVMMTLVPEAWERHETMSEEKKAFYEYNACSMEPWDGPASIPFTDGKCIGAILDRNGLRPSRYTVTKDDYVIMSSETGVVEVDTDNISYNGRLEPGKMFLVDMEKGCIISDEDIKEEIASKNEYRQWIDKNLIHLKDLSYEGETPQFQTDIQTLQKAFGYSREDLNILLTPMGVNAQEAIGSMGADTPLAVLSEKPQLIYNYFKQLFAQVTNPPLDGIREELVTSLGLTLGREQNIFETSPEHCRQLKIDHPILTNEELARIKSTEKPGLKPVTISTLYPVAEGEAGMKKALDRIAKEAIKAVKEKDATILILSDRGVDEKLAHLPALLASSSIHNVLKREKLRTLCDIILETGEAREVHHFACLIGYSASAINPYLAICSLRQLARDGVIPESENITENFRKAVSKGLIKVMSKIGISTLNSYRGAQIFEALGLNKDLVDQYFTKTITRIEGATLGDIANEYSKLHENAFPVKEIAGSNKSLDVGGQYQWRRNGEKHMFNPLTIAKLQQAVRTDNPSTYKEYADLINDQSRSLMTLRGLMDFKDRQPIDIEEVEPWTDIVKRFKTGAMSYGSISSEAHENLAIAMNRMGGKSNSGEGGEDPNRFHPDHNGNLRNSAIKQVASGRFGVSSHYLVNAKEIQIKMAQGAKPGEGGQLPGEKVYPWVAECRNSTPYVGLISPPPHHDIYSIEDLSQLIFDLKNANRHARINVKLVSEAGVGTVAAGVAKAKADVILIAGFDGGTGASPLTSLKHTGLPWELGVAEAHQTLMMNDLRDRIVLECDGQLKTGRDVAIAALLGAEEFGFATAPLVASGCVMMRVCHLNTCPVGIATQDPELRKRFKGTPENVINYFHFVAEELRQIMAELGFRTINEMVGQVQKLEMSEALNQAKASKLDYSPILFKPEVPEDKSNFNTQPQDHELENVLDMTLLKLANDSLYKKKKVYIDLPIVNTDRAAGTILSSEISRMHGKAGLPTDTINVTLRGHAGQSLAAYGAPGLTVKVLGDTNDYLGKGLSGAHIIVMPPEDSSIVAEENIITGNVLLYGAIRGEAYIRGIGGERFCVRNSGAKAVIEGIGDHGCEYMTGGIAVILGSTGRNFAAGMSGGVAYIYDEAGDFAEKRCNHEMVDLEVVVETADINELKGLIENHYRETQSTVAWNILQNWETALSKFIKVMPRDYKRALQRLAEEKESAESKEA